MSAAFIERLRMHVKLRSNATAFVFVRRPDENGEHLTWGQLWQSVEALSTRIPLYQSSRPTAAFLCCQDNKNFLVALIACWMRGLTVVPAAGGFGARLASRNRHILKCSRPDLIIHDLSSRQAEALVHHAPQANQIDLTVELSREEVPVALTGVGGRLLQFTSGSTSEPKPILLDPGQIEANCQAIARCYDLTEESIGVNWLPMYHDMGLVGTLLAPVWIGLTSVILNSTVFMQRPWVWFEHIGHWRATITAAPNFAFEHLCRTVEGRELSGLDLSSLTSVIIGGEPVLEATVRRLLQRFEPYGLPAASIAPSYGMAEVGLLVSSGRRASGPLFSSRHTPSPTACVGPVIRELTLTVRDPSTHGLLPEGEVGEIFLSGASAGQVIHSEDDWRAPPPRREIRSGDFGYLEGDALFVTGRTARKIIVRGHNILAEDAERLVLESQASGIIEAAVALGIEADGSQQLCLLIEVAGKLAALQIQAINLAIISQLGVKPSHIVQLRGGTLPRTSSGKVQHAVASESYLSGEFSNRVIAYVLQTPN